MKQDDAERLNILLIQVQAKLSQSVAFVRDHDSTESLESYRRLIADLSAQMQWDVQERLWRDHPQLRPKFAGGTYDVNPSIHDQSFTSSAVNQMHNKRMKPARIACSTHEQLRRSLAAYSWRWA